MPTKEQIELLYLKYLDVIKWEINDLGCNPTEVRHLIGRLGEFHCAIVTDGSLAKETNQHGFDVISSEGRRISVKTTAQTVGFVAFNKKTFLMVDEIMVLQYTTEGLVQIYFGDVDTIRPFCRTWKETFELDISKLKKFGIVNKLAIERFSHARNIPVH